MNKNISISYHIPEGLVRNVPSVTLLHGYGGTHIDFFSIDSLTFWADSLQVVLVSVDGQKDSYYVNSPRKKEVQYLTFITQELQKWMHDSLPVQKSSSSKMITGFSMGGHGALYNAIKSQTIFGVAGSISGVVNLYHSGFKKKICRLLGPAKKKKKKWHSYSALQLVQQNQYDSTLHFLIACGNNDYFIKDNKQLIELLQRNQVHKIDSFIQPGQHDFNFVRRALKWQLIYFSNRF